MRCRQSSARSRSRAAATPSPATPARPAFRILSVGSTGDLTLNAATLTGGNDSYGGGIDSWGALTLNNSTVSGNSAGIYGGGGIHTAGAATLNNSTVSGNTTTGAGGGISNGGALALHNSTVSGNSAADLGGGIFNSIESQAAIESSTVTGNATQFEGGGIWSEGTLTLARSVIAGNTAVDFGNEFVDYEDGASLGYNLFGHSGENTPQAFFGFPLAAGDIDATGNGATPTALAAILDTTLADNGGSTWTHALVAGSPALDAAPSGPAADQRGIARPQGCGFDIGAFELEAPPCNRAPEIAAVNASVTVDEGQVATNSGTVSDPDGDVVALSASAGAVTNNGNGTWSWSYATAGAPLGAQTVTVSADDGNGGTDEASFALVVNEPLPINARINGTECELAAAITAANTDTATGTARRARPVRTPSNC